MHSVTKSDLARNHTGNCTLKAILLRAILVIELNMAWLITILGERRLVRRKSAQAACEKASRSPARDTGHQL